MQRRRLLASAMLCLLPHALHACLAWQAVSALVRVVRWQPEASSDCAGAVLPLGTPRSAGRGRLEGQLPRAGYIRAVLEEGLPLEVFIEGGRSRDGRITLPRLGILSFVVDAFLDGRMDKARAQQGPPVHPHTPPRQTARARLYCVHPAFCGQAAVGWNALSVSLIRTATEDDHSQPALEEAMASPAPRRLRLCADW